MTTEPVLLPPPLPASPRTKIDWLVNAQKLNYQLLGSILASLRQLTSTQEALMATVAELQTALDRNTAATTAAAAAIQTEIAQLQAAIDALSTATPPTQAQLDQLNASSDALEAATAALAADDPATPTP